MRNMLLVIAILLTVPAFAQKSHEACQRLALASDKLDTLIQASRNKDWPLCDADKEEMRQAVDEFDKAIKDLYEIKDIKVAHKKPSKVKSAGQRIGTWSSNHLFQGGGGATFSPASFGLPQMQGPVVTPNGIFPVSQGLNGSLYFPMGFPR